MTDEMIIGDVADAPMAQETPAPTEKMLPQSQVNEIVRAAHARAIEKGRSEAMANANQNPGFDQDAIRQMIADETRKAREEAMQEERTRMNQQEAQRIAGEIVNKLAVGREKYGDFDAVVDEIGIANHAKLMQMANKYDNLHDIVYELGTNPSKIASLAVLAYTNPNLAENEMRKLSESVKMNESAKKAQQKTPRPLSGINPSQAVGDDGRPKSVSDLRKLPQFRF